jgi:hypothetical protein
MRRCIMKYIGEAKDKNGDLLFEVEADHHREIGEITCGILENGDVEKVVWKNADTKKVCAVYQQKRRRR